MAYIHSWVTQEWEAPKCPMETAGRGGLVSWEAFLLPSRVCFQEPERVEQIMRWALSTAQSALKKCFWSTGVKASSRRAVFFFILFLKQLFPESPLSENGGVLWVLYFIFLFFIYFPLYEFHEWLGKVREAGVQSAGDQNTVTPVPWELCI